MKKCLIIIALVISLTVLVSAPTPVFAEENIDFADLLSKINITELETFFNSLDQAEQKLLGGSFENLLKNLSSGIVISPNSIFTYVLTLVHNLAKSIFPGFAVLLCIILITVLLNGIKSDFASKSIHSVINFASACIIGAILCFTLTDTVQSCLNFINKTFKLVQIIFPILFSVLITMGAGTTATVYQSGITLFLSALSMLISSFVAPIIIISSILSVITNISPSLNLSKIPTFMTNTSKKILSVSFVFFSSLLALQGISSQVYDNVGIRIAKFSLGKYIPILGGYLSSGFDYIYAGSVLLKNSLGIAFILLMFISVLPLIIKLVFMNFLISILSLASSCVGNNTVSKMLDGIKENVSLMITCIVGLVVSLSVFAVMTVLSFNSIS